HGGRGKNTHEDRREQHGERMAIGRELRSLVRSLRSDHGKDERGDGCREQLREETPHQQLQPSMRDQLDGSHGGEIPEQGAGEKRRDDHSDDAGADEPPAGGVVPSGRKRNQAEYGGQRAGKQQCALLSNGGEQQFQRRESAAHGWNSTKMSSSPSASTSMSASSASRSEARAASPQCVITPVARGPATRSESSSRRGSAA